MNSQYRRLNAVNNPHSLDANTLFIRGNQLIEIGDISGAEACFKQGILIEPNFAEAYANLGMLLDQLGKSESAEVNYRRSIELNPEIHETHLNLGSLLSKQKRFKEAEKAYRLAITLQPHSSISWSNLGVLLACLKREREAEKCYRTAISLDESYETARFNLSYLLLRQGRFDEGWHCLQSRKWSAALTDHLTCPRWNGESLVGKSILISYEAGHGDMIQFCRYASILKEQGAYSVTQICHPALKDLFGSLEGVDRVIAFDEQIIDSGYDFWTLPFSIPYYCKTRLESIPAKIPYLDVPDNHIKKWAAFLPAGKLRIGLAWKGNPLFENDADRSLPSLEVLNPLGSVAGIHLISLQKGAGETEAAHPTDGLSILELGSLTENFADTAAVVAQLDLIICVDTAIAHLAGALGKKCWVLLPEYKTDWRWLTDRNDSPWYPGTMRLFRQSHSGNWSTVVSDVQIELEKFVQTKV